MRKQIPAVGHQDVDLEVPEGDLVDSDILKTSFYGFVIKTKYKTYLTCKGLCVSRILVYTARMLLSKSLRVT